MSEKQEEQKQFSVDAEELGGQTVRLTGDPASGLVGQIIAERYRVQEIVGRGGMAVVYKAHHMLMNKTVAIKCLLPQLVSESSTLQRFKNESQAASSIDHPNMVTVHDFGITPDGQPFLVMDYLQGKTLADTIKTDGPLSLDRFFAVFTQIASVLEHAHKKHVVHRDIKPSNIIIEPDGKAKLLDFGIAKIVSPEGQGLSLTRTGDVFGSPLYMSPEQSNGQKVDERSDIYELGCVMYEALSGKPPFAGDNIYELIQRHAQDTPASLGTKRKSSAALNSIEAIIFRCIAKKPEDRYQSVAELSDALIKVRTLAETPLSRLGSAIKLHSLRRNLRGKKSIAGALSIVALVLLTLCVVQVIMIQKNPASAPEERLGLGAPSTLQTVVRAAFQLLNKGKLVEAEAEFEKAQSMAKSAHSFADEARILKARRLIAYMSRDRKQVDSLTSELKSLIEAGGDEASRARAQVSVLRQAFKMIPENPSGNQKREIRGLLRQGIQVVSSLQQEGQTSTALELLGLILPRSREIFGESDPLSADCLLHVAECEVAGAERLHKPLTDAQIDDVLAKATSASKVFKQPLQISAAKLVAARALSDRNPDAALKAARQLVDLPQGQIGDAARLRARMLVADCLESQGKIREACDEYAAILASPGDLPMLLQNCAHEYARLRTVLSRPTAPDEIIALGKQLELTQPLAAAELYAGASRFFYNRQPASWDELTEHSLLLTQSYGEPVGAMAGYLVVMRARYFESVRDYTQAKDLAAQSYAIASLRGDKSEATEAYTYEIYLQMMGGQNTLAKQRFDGLMKRLEKEPAQKFPDLNEWLRELALKLGTTEQKKFLEERSLERINAKASVTSSERTAYSLRMLAEYQADTGNPDRALISIRRAASVLETEGIQCDRESLIRALNDMATIYSMLGQKEKSEIASQQSREVEAGTFKFGRHWSP